MDWNPNYRYKILGKLIRSGNEILFIFDLTSPEIFPRTLKDKSYIDDSLVEQFYRKSIKSFRF